MTCLNRKFLRVMGLLLTLFFASLTQANQLYRATVPAENADLRESLHSGLEQVLVKVSGNPKVATVPSIRQKINDPRPYVESYQIKKDESSAAKLVIQYSKRGVNQLLSSSGQTLWVGDRPDILTWLVMKKSDKWVSTDDNDELVQTAREAARQKGFDLLMPFWDLKDLSRLKPAELGQIDCQQIADISQRYQNGSQPVLSGVIEEKDTGQLEGKWQLKSQQQCFVWHESADNISGIMDNAFEHVLDRLADQYTVLHSKNLTKKATLVVNNINDMNALGCLEAILVEQPMIESHTLHTVSGSEITFVVQYSGQKDVLKAELANNKHLKRSDNNKDIIQLQWRG